jgi:hypothetical protein
MSERRSSKINANAEAISEASTATSDAGYASFLRRGLMEMLSGFWRGEADIGS